MLLKSYTKRIVRVECNPSFESVHCIAHLEQNIEKVLPYLNASLGGFEYLKDPPAVTFKASGKLITVQGEQIAVNALKNEKEADKIIEWLKSEINEAWTNRDQITPSYKGQAKPNMIDILKLLPKTNCKACGQATCMVFATMLASGAKSPEDCPEMENEFLQKLKTYLDQFQFE